MDIICLKYFDIKEDYCFSSEYLNNRIHPNNGCIKCPAESEFMLEYIHLMDKRLQNNAPIQWGEFGPAMMKHLLTIYESEEYIMKPEVFIAPISFYINNRLAFYLFHGENNTSVDEYLTGYSIHLYNELWRISSLDKNKAYPASSIYEYLKRKYL